VSNGGHYFVQRPEQLAAIFDQEMELLAQTVVRDAQLVVDVQPGVSIDHVFDRAFERQGDRIVVPLGAFAGRDRKSLLVRLRVPGGPDGERPVASVTLRYDDLAQGRRGECGGALVARASSDESALSQLDAVVSGRLTRSETRLSLEQANTAWNAGDKKGAREVLRRQRSAAQGRRASVSGPLGGGLLAPSADRSFDESQRALEKAETGFAADADGEEGASRVRSNQVDAFDLAR
jgi:Ca-activated chloride channel family protein